MPAGVSTSPAVVMVRRPVTKVSGSAGIGTGPQRRGSRGISLSSRAKGAERISPLSARR